MDINQDKSGANGAGCEVNASDNPKSSMKDGGRQMAKDAGQITIKQSQETVKKQKQHPLMPMVKSFSGLRKESLDKSLQ